MINRSQKLINLEEGRFKKDLWLICVILHEMLRNIFLNLHEVIQYQYLFLLWLK